MRRTNWLVATAAGAGLSLLTVGGMAQLKTSPKGDPDDVPKGKALGVSDDVDVPKGKAFGVKGEVPQGKPLGTERAASERRRETRRIPVIDANASSTFRSTQLIGTNITDEEGRTIGKIVDFVIDSRGNISYQIVSFSGAPGFTGKLFAIPFSGLRLSTGANNMTTAQFAFDPALLQNAPSFSSTRFPDFSDQIFLAELRTFFATALADTSPIDPTSPANGPGDRPVTVSPALPRTGTEPAATAPSSRIPGTTGTENAGFPATAGAATRTATSGSAAAGADLSGSITSNRAGTITKSGSSVVGKTGSPAGSSRPGGTVVGRTGSPASSSIPSDAAGEVRTAARVDASASRNRLAIRSSQMVGLSIQDKDGHTMGKVIDIVSDGDGNRQFAVVSLSGDKRNIVLPASALRFQAGAHGSSFATLRVAPGQLKNAPSFTGSEWPDFSSEEFLTDFQDFYQPLFPDMTFNADGSVSTTVEGTTPGGSRSTPQGTRTPDWPSVPIPPGGPVPRPGTPTTGKTTPGGSKSTPGGTRTPDWPSRPIPPGGPVSRPGTETDTPATGKTTPGGSRSTPGGTRTPDWPSLPIPPGGPVPRPGAVGPRLPAPGSKVPGIPGVPAVPATPAVPGGPGVPATPATPAVPAAPSAPGGGAPGGGGSGGGASAPGK